MRIEKHRTVIRRGTWLYDAVAPMPVAIVELDYDFWHELGRTDGTLEPDEHPQLNADGVLYYVCLRSDPRAHPGWVDSPGFASVEAAIAWAANQVPSAISWMQPGPRGG